MLRRGVRSTAEAELLADEIVRIRESGQLRPVERMQRSERYYDAPERVASKIMGLCLTLPFLNQGRGLWWAFSTKNSPRLLGTSNGGCLFL